MDGRYVHVNRGAVARKSRGTCKNMLEAIVGERWLKHLPYRCTVCARVSLMLPGAGLAKQQIRSKIPNSNVAPAWPIDPKPNHAAHVPPSQNETQTQNAIQDTHVAQNLL